MDRIPRSSWESAWFTFRDARKSGASLTGAIADACFEWCEWHMCA